MDQKNLEVENVIKEIKRDIIDYRLRGQIISSIMNILEQYDRKKYTKRITDIIKANFFGEYSIYFEDRYGMLHLSLWGKEISYYHKIDLFLGYISNNPRKLVDMNFIQKHNAGYLSLSKTADKLETKFPELNFAISQWNAYIKNLHRTLQNIGYSNDEILYSIQSQFINNLKQQIF